MDAERFDFFGGQSMLNNISREICKLCYTENPIGFNVPDEVWRTIVPEQVVNSVVCINCFTRMGDAKMVQWDKDIEFWPVSRFTFLQCNKELLK